ncbi:MAG TPA: DUF6240 domain-containing protein [Lachnospiraceae bacterium]|nr:DUF6240 domain-containing protein [Lachnospiraceae bacterium]
MRISFDHTTPANIDKVTTAYQTTVSQTDRIHGGCALDISGTVTDNEAYGIHGRTAEEVMQAAGSEDVTLYRNYMTVMSNSMSDEDFSKLLKEGYDPSDTDIETAVTIVDTIKAELIKAGVNITGYTDNVNIDKLTEITGNQAYAMDLVHAFTKEDIPVTDENVQQAMEAFQRGKQLTELSDGTKKYMVQNQLTPDIDSMYLAKHAGAADANRQPQGYFQDEFPGYFAKKANISDVSGLQEQIEKVISKSGYEVSDQKVQQALWLVNKGVPLTKDNLEYLNKIEDISLPATNQELFGAIASAIAEGHTPGEGQLSITKSVYRKAADCMNFYEQQYKFIAQQPETPENRKARLQLEEVRLHMTVEANVKLLKSGFSIDTAPIEETIDALKKLETNQSGTVSMKIDTANLCKQTLTKTREIPYLPATALGSILSAGKTLTVNSLYETGKSQQIEYEKAGEAYETMMTLPRADLGDSIKTAFRNVDALLENMGQDLTDENRKAVRGLSYNHMELTEENLLAIKGADKVVQRVIEKMTPPAVLSMIREGLNPLTTSMEDLEDYLSGMDEYTQDSNKFSQFLYHLETSKGITEEEKQSFIGVYRLLHQIQKSDGAAIAKLVNTQAQINFENLLSAVRTGKIKGVDVLVDENYGTLQEAIEKGATIDTQIESSFQKQRAEEIRTINKVGDQTIRLLKQLEQPITIDHLLATDSIRINGSKPFRKLAETASDSWKQILLTSSLENSFADKDTFQGTYENFMSESQKLAQTLSFGENMTSVDVRAMQLTCKQLHIETMQAVMEEEYAIPQVIDGELTAIHLKLVHNTEESGKVSVSIDTNQYGKLAGEFHMSAEGISGLFAGQGQEAIGILHETVTVLSEKLSHEKIACNSIQVVDGYLSDNENSFSKEKLETKRLYRLAGIVINALKETI